MTSFGSGIEKAVIGAPIQERSRFMAKAVQLAPSLDPQHACDLEAVRPEQLWAKEIYEERIDPAADEFLPITWKEVSAKWDWMRRDHGSYDTPEGPLLFGMEGAKAVQRVTDAAFRRWNLKKEPRAQDPENQALIRDCDPVLAEHRTWIEAVPYCRAKVAVALGGR